MLCLFTYNGPLLAGWKWKFSNRKLIQRKNFLMSQTSENVSKSDALWILFVVWCLLFSHKHGARLNWIYLNLKCCEWAPFFYLIRMDAIAMVGYRRTETIKLYWKGYLCALFLLVPLKNYIWLCLICWKKRTKSWPHCSNLISSLFGFSQSASEGTVPSWYPLLVVWGWILWGRRSK